MTDKHRYPEVMVVMLDLEDLTLHRPATGDGKHLVAACRDAPLARCTVGPEAKVAPRARQLCPECFP